MKKLITVALALCMTFSLCACGGSSSSSTAASTTAASSKATSAASTTAASSSTTETAAADDGQVYRLSVSFHDSAQALKTQYVQKWADAVNEASNGRLEVTVYAGGTIAGAADALDAVKQQTADIAVCFSGFFPGQFTLSDVITMPLLGISNSVQGTNVLWDMYENVPEVAAEYEDFKVIMLYAGPNNIICANKEINSLADFSGLKLRASSGTATDMTTAWGGTPMSISSSELYQSMEKGVIDGYIIDWTGVNAWNLYEVTEAYLELPFFTQTWAVLMNKDSYEALPEDLQALIDEYSTREWSLGFGELNEQEASDARQTAIDGGATVVSIGLDDAALDEWKPAAEEYIANWEETNTTDTFDAAAFVEDAKALGEKYAE